MNDSINLEYELIYEKPDEEKLFFKNKNSETLIQISKTEFEIIQIYAKTKSISAVQEYFAKDFELEDTLISELINKARFVNLIIDPVEYNSKRKRKQLKFQRLEMLIGYLTDKMYSPLKKIGLELTLDFKGNFNFYKLLSISFPKSRFSSFIERDSSLIILSYFILLLSSIVFLIVHLPINLNANTLLDTSAPSGILVFFSILFGILISTFFHELGHYIMYVKYGGRTSKMGIALLIGFLPVMYVSTNSLYLWPNKLPRILVASAGVLVDVLLLLLAIDWLLIIFPSAFSFYIIFFIFLFFVRIIANINPFIPGTDGYFVLADIVNIPSLYQSATFSVHKFSTNMKSLKFSLIDRPQLISVLYLILSVIFITCYYLLIGGFILLPFFMKLFF